MKAVMMIGCLTLLFTFIYIIVYKRTARPSFLTTTVDNAQLNTGNYILYK